VTIPSVRRSRIRLGLVWVIAFCAAGLTAWLHPAPLSRDLDSASILTIAGLNLVAVSVTFGVVGLQTQHLAETYTRSVARAIDETRRWPAVLALQAASVMATIGLALGHPMVASGISAAILLGVGLVESGLVLSELLAQFDSLQLIALLGRRSVDRLNATRPVEPESVIPDAQSVLDLIVRGAEKADTEVTAAGLEAWRSMFFAYLENRGPLFYSDQYLAWKFARLQELIETYGRRSAGVVLPKLIQGAVDLGIAAARHLPGVGEGINEGVYYTVRCLEAAVATSVDAHLSPAAASALVGIGDLGEALVDSQKVNTAGEIARSLSRLGKALDSRPDLAHWATNGLARLIIRLSGEFSLVHMASSSAEEAVEGLVAIVKADHSDLGPTHFLTAPLSDTSLPRLVFQSASAAAKQDTRRLNDWTSVSARLAHLAFEIPLRTDLPYMVRSNGAQCAVGVLLALMVAPYSDATVKVFSDLAVKYLKVLDMGEPDRLHLVDGLAEALLAAYYASRSNSKAAGVYRTFITDVGSHIAGWETKKRRRFAAALRLVGAAAIRDAEEELSIMMARASLPPIPSRSRSIPAFTDAFETGPFGFVGLLGRPGVPLSIGGDSHLDEDARRKFLHLEATVDRPRPAT
jgi:hypothetical protein